MFRVLSCLQYPGEQSYDLQRPGQRPHEVLCFSDPGEILALPIIPKQQHRLLTRPNRGSCKAVYNYCLILEHLTRPTVSVFWGEYVVTC